MNYIDKVAENIAAQYGRLDGVDHEDWRLFRIYAVLALTVGEDVTWKHVHDAWSAWRASINMGLVPVKYGADGELLDQRDTANWAEAIRKTAFSIRTGSLL